MARAVHPALAKRIVLTDARSGTSELRHMTAELVETTRECGDQDAAK